MNKYKHKHEITPKAAGFNVNKALLQNLSENST